MREAETNPNVFTPDRIWQAYAYALSCVTDKELAVAMGITEDRLRNWKQEHPAFYRAVLKAREASAMTRAGNGALLGHIGNSLPEDLRALWEELIKGGDAEHAARMSLATRGDYDRQRLLVYALATTNFDLAACMRALDVSKATMDRWVRTDPRFVQLWDEVMNAKKNFLESALMRLVEGGNVKAILFANERLNKDRGFGNTVTVEGTINHNVAVLDLSKLNLDPDTMFKVLAAAQAAGLIDPDGLLMTDPTRPKIVDGTATAVPESR